MSGLDTRQRGLPVLLGLHSLFLDPRMFDDLMEAASGRFRVVLPEFRGQVHGTHTVSDTVTMDECAEDVISLIDQLSLAPVYMVAQSMGGDVAVRVAARRPDTIAALVLAGSSVRAEPAEHLDDFLPLTDRIAAEGFTEEVVETMMGIMFGATTLADPSKAGMLKTWRERIAALPPELAHAIRGVVLREDATDLLAEVEAPTLVISGDEDVPRPPEWSDEMAAKIRNSELWRLHGVGHSPILEAPEEVVPRILAFFEAVLSERRGGVATSAS